MEYSGEVPQNVIYCKSRRLPVGVPIKAGSTGPGYSFTSPVAPQNTYMLIVFNCREHPVNVLESGNPIGTCAALSSFFKIYNLSTIGSITITVTAQDPADLITEDHAIVYFGFAREFQVAQQILSGQTFVNSFNLENSYAINVSIQQIETGIYFDFSSSMNGVLYMTETIYPSPSTEINLLKFVDLNEMVNCEIYNGTSQNINVTIYCFL